MSIDSKVISRGVEGILRGGLVAEVTALVWGIAATYFPETRDFGNTLIYCSKLALPANVPAWLLAYMAKKSYEQESPPVKTSLVSYTPLGPCEGFNKDGSPIDDDLDSFDTDDLHL